MKKINFYNLTLELTRKCNMKCSHCLRGKAQKKNITEEIIDKVLEQTSFINDVLFSGGEPSLNVEAINYFTKRVKELGIPVMHFYIVTNGKRYSKKLVEALNSLYEYCCECDPFEAEGFCGLTMSKTQFHEEASLSAYGKYSDLVYFKEDKGSEIMESLILNEGFAYENALGRKNVSPDDLKIDFEFEEDVIYVDEGNVYVNCNGDIVPGCDFSYESQIYQKIGNILEDSFESILSLYVGENQIV